MSRMILLAVAAMAVMLALSVTGCGGGTGLELLTVSPSTTQGTVDGAVVTFSVTGYYNDGSTKSNGSIKDLNWQSSDPNIAVVTTTGVARCIAASVSPVSITASAPGIGGMISDTAQLTCQVPV